MGDTIKLKVRRYLRTSGYYPVFSFLSSLNGLIDLASVGLIGQKAGFSTPIEQQLRSILDVVGSALKDVSTHSQEEQKEAIRRHEDKIRLAAEYEERRQLIIRGGWHDGRLDCVAGNGVMSELGFGEETMRDSDLAPATVVHVSPPMMDDTAPIKGEAVPPTSAILKVGPEGISGDKEGNKSIQIVSPIPNSGGTDLDAEAEFIKSLPIVVLKNFAQKTAKGDLWNVMAEWGASLVENRVGLSHPIPFACGVSGCVPDC